MRACILAAAVLLLGGCPPPAALTQRQWQYVRVHPELGEPGRQALLERSVAVGQSIERVMVTWDGLRVEHKPRESGSRLDTYEFFVPIDGRPIYLHGPSGREEIPHGRVLLTFRDQLLVTWVRLE